MNPRTIRSFRRILIGIHSPLSTKNRQEEAVLKTIIGWETPVFGQSNTFTSREGALTGTAPYQKKSSNLFFRGSWLYVSGCETSPCLAIQQNMLLISKLVLGCALGVCPERMGSICVTSRTDRVDLLHAFLP